MVGLLTADAYRADGLLEAADHPVESTYEAKLLDAARRAREAELWVAAEEDGQILGTVTWCPPGSSWRQLALRNDQAEFRMLSVAPAGRRRGVGRAMVEACLSRARRDRMSEVVIWSHPLMVGSPPPLPRDALRAGLRPRRQPGARRTPLGLPAAAGCSTR